MTAKDTLAKIAELALIALRELDDNELQFKLLTLVPDEPPPKPQTTFGEWLDEWFAVYKKPLIKSWRQIEILIRLHIPDELKALPLSALTAPKIQAAINAIESSRNRESTYNVYTESLRQARIAELMASEPMLGVKKPKHKRTKGQALTGEHQAEFLWLLQGTPLEHYAKHLLLTGSRPSEPLRLYVGDIDMQRQELHIRGTKTDGADRYIPLFQGIAENLADIEPRNNRYFPYSYDYYESKFTAMHFYDYSLKDLRHTFATRAVESGVSMKTVQLWLGHSTYEQTANTYSHVTDRFNREEAAKLTIDLTPDSPLPHKS